MRSRSLRKTARLLFVTGVICRWSLAHGALTVPFATRNNAAGQWCRFIPHSTTTTPCSTVSIFSRPQTALFSDKNSDMEKSGQEDEEVPVFVRGFSDGEISDEVLEDVETGAPSKWLVMKELLGINFFTYMLAVTIVTFLSLNSLLGPGWLGQAIGMKGAGTFLDISTSLPDTLDLNAPENLL